MSSRRHFSARAFPIGTRASLILLAALAPAEAPASSCCAGGGGQSVCVLPAEQRYQLGVTTTFRSVQGEFDPYGDYTPSSEGTAFRQLTTVFGGAYRIGEDWQAAVSVPVVMNQQVAQGSSRTARGIGDPALEGRYTVWEDLAFLYYRPELLFYGGARLPLGASVEDTPDPSGLAAVGDGGTTLHAGVTAAKLYRPVKLSLDGTLFFPLARTVDRMRGAPVADPYRLRTGTRLQLLESATYLLSERWSASAGLRQLWVLRTSIDGAPVDGSAQRLFSSLANVSYFPDPAWAVSLHFETAFPFYRYLANQANAQSVGLALTYGGE